MRGGGEGDGREEGVEVMILVVVISG